MKLCLVLAAALLIASASALSTARTTLGRRVARSTSGPVPASPPSPPAAGKGADGKAVAVVASAAPNDASNDELLKDPAFGNFLINCFAFKDIQRNAEHESCPRAVPAEFARVLPELERFNNQGEVVDVETTLKNEAQYERVIDMQGSQQLLINVPEQDKLRSDSPKTPSGVAIAPVAPPKGVAPTPSTPAAAAAALVETGVTIPSQDANKWPSNTIPVCVGTGFHLQTLFYLVWGIARVVHNTNINVRFVGCNAPGHKIKLVYQANTAESSIGMTVAGGKPAGDANTPANTASTDQELKFDAGSFNTYSASHE